MAANESSVSVSGTNTYDSIPVNVKNLDGISIQLIWTGTPTGTFTVFHSITGKYWDSIPVSPVITQPAGSSGNWTVSIPFETSFWIKVQYINASGSGVIDAIIAAKDVN